MLKEVKWLAKICTWVLRVQLLCSFIVLSYQAAAQHLDLSEPLLSCNSTSLGNSHILKRVQLPPKENNLFIQWT